MDFSIPHQRELTGEERRILSLLLADRPDYVARTDHLKVVARCGCGECPTIMFGEPLDPDPVGASGGGVGDVRRRRPGNVGICVIRMI